MSSRRTPGRGRRAAGRCGVLLAAGLLALGGCEWLLSLDRTAPTCTIRSPVDSSTVSGTVVIRADAVDSVGVSRIDFYADGGLLGTDSSASAAMNWATDSLADESWHVIYCVAHDLAGNAGYSEPLDVRVARPDQRSVFHGAIGLQNGSYFSAGFVARAGDSLLGDARVASNGVISRFLWLDRANFGLYRQQQAFSALHEQTNVNALGLVLPVAQADSFYIVFENTTGYPQTYWARFRLE